MGLITHLKFDYVCLHFAVLKYRPILTYTLDDALRSEGFEAVKAGMSADLIIQEIYEAVWRVCQYLRRIARPVSGYGEIVQVYYLLNIALFRSWEDYNMDNG